MKELKDIVHDLKYGIKLKKLGVKQDSLWYWWVFSPLSKDEKQFVELRERDLTDKRLTRINTFSAFTSTELLEGMPERLNTRPHFGLEIIKLNNHYRICYKNVFTYRVFNNEMREDKKLPNALAQMRIYLLENKLMEIK